MYTRWIEEAPTLTVEYMENVLKDCMPANDPQFQLKVSALHHHLIQTAQYSMSLLSRGRKVSVSGTGADLAIIDRYTKQLTDFGETAAYVMSFYANNKLWREVAAGSGLDKPWEPAWVQHDLVRMALEHCARLEDQPFLPLPQSLLDLSVFDAGDPDDTTWQDRILDQLTSMERPLLEHLLPADRRPPGWDDIQEPLTGLKSRFPLLDCTDEQFLAFFDELLA